jgi:hypothetical protein
MLLFPTRFSYSYNYLPASRSSRAPAGLFYFTALADGGQLSAPFSPITRWRKAGGVF